MTRFNIRLLESESAISRSIMVALRDHLSIAFSRLPTTIARPIKDAITQALKSEPEYASLKSGKLRYEMGIENTSNVDTIIESLVNTLDIQYRPITHSLKSLSGGFSLTMMKSDDLGGVVNTQEAYVNDAQRGYSLPWLTWLLLRGNEVLVYDYEVRLGSNPRSRSGNAIMVSSKKNWRVPPEFVGSQDDNWTTRAISAAESSILTIIEKAVKDSI